MKIKDFVKTILGYDKMKVNDFRIEQEEYHKETIFIATVELHKKEQYRCPVCGEKCGKYGLAIRAIA